MFKKIVKQLSLASVLTVAAVAANASTVTLNGTIVGCFGLCGSLSGPGNLVIATVDIPTADGIYQGTDLGAIATPNISLEGNFANTLEFIAELYSDAGQTPFGLPTLPALPTAPGADTEVTVTGGVASGIVSVAGVGSTTGAPVWGIFDLDAGTFESYIFLADTDGNAANGETPGHVLLANGTFSAVPVPASAWLMMTALAGLAGARARRNK